MVTSDRRQRELEADWIERLPKVELHLHLEGAIPHDALWQLICKYGGDPRSPSREALADVFRYRSFPEFIETWLWKQGFLREYDDLELIAGAFARELVRQRIVYAEVFYSPSDVARHGLTTGRVSAAIRRGLDAVAGTEVALIADLVRDQGPAGAMHTLEEVAQVAAEAGVVGVGLGGSEQRFPPAPFAPVFERARELGLHTTAHAGEAAGPESVWSAIRELRVERIGHGIRSIEDRRLVGYLAEQGIPLEICPGSNVATGVVPSLEAHPIRRLFDAGVLVTVNSDDPAMFGLTLAGEFEALERVHGFSPYAVLPLLLNAVQASWAPPARKQELQALVDAADPTP